MSSARPRKKRLWLWAALLLLLLAAAAAIRLWPRSVRNAAPPASLTVTVIDVGQGSSTLVQAGETAVLIDCGERDEGYAVADALKKAGVRSLDLLVLTHLHTDHYGGAITVLSSTPAAELVMPDTPEALLPTAGAYEALLDVIEEKSIPVTPLSAPEARTLSEGVTLTFLDGFLDEPDGLNDTSLTMRLDCGEASFLITGDAGTAQEDRLRLGGAPIAADVLIAGHHGSGGSSRQYFLNAVKPLASVISVGAGNSYGLPNARTIERLSCFGPVYRTDWNESVTFSTDGETIHVAAAHIDDTLDAREE